MNAEDTVCAYLHNRGPSPLWRIAIDTGYPVGAVAGAMESARVHGIPIVAEMHASGTEYRLDVPSIDSRDTMVVTAGDTA